jgi:hypothetical protein
MGKKIVLGGVAVFVLWSVLDFVIHGIILRGAYEATAHLWRPMAEMKYGVMYVAVFIAALAFAAIYGLLVGAKSLATGAKFGLIFGIGAGVAMGYGTYSMMPIPYSMAFTWFLGSAIEYTLAGCLVGLIIKE